MVASSDLFKQRLDGARTRYRIRPARHAKGAIRLPRHGVPIAARPEREGAPGTEWPRVSSPHGSGWSAGRSSDERARGGSTKARCRSFSTIARHQRSNQRKHWRRSNVEVAMDQRARQIVVVRGPSDIASQPWDEPGATGRGSANVEWLIEPQTHTLYHTVLQMLDAQSVRATSDECLPVRDVPHPPRQQTIPHGHRTFRLISSPPPADGAGARKLVRDLPGVRSARPSAARAQPGTPPPRSPAGTWLRSQTPSRRS